MKITGLNLDIIWKNKTENFNIIEKELQNQEADLFLPEMFSTGFCMDASEVSDRNLESLEFLKKMAKEKMLHFAEVLRLKKTENFTTECILCSPILRLIFMIKDIFFFFGEDKVYTPGKERVIVNYLGFRILCRFVMIFVFLFLQEIMMIMMRFYMWQTGPKKSRSMGTSVKSESY
jgi:predicted amidohydrolase